MKLEPSRVYAKTLNLRASTAGFQSVPFSLFLSGLTRTRRRDYRRHAYLAAHSHWHIRLRIAWALKTLPGSLLAVSITSTLASPTRRCKANFWPVLRPPFGMLIAFSVDLWDRSVDTPRRRQCDSGVAIVTALMSSCTAGYGLASAPVVFFGCLYLLFINSVSIGFATLLIVLCLNSNP